jgi:hypothetical protein
MPDKTWVAGDVVTAADTNTYLTHTGSSWNTWTPVITQSGTVTATVDHATWFRAGRLIVASFRLAITGTGSANNQVSFTPPVNCARTFDLVGVGIIQDASAGILNYTATLAMDAANNRVVFLGQGLGVSPTALGSTATGFTAALASGDVISGYLTYEAAS